MAAGRGYTVCHTLTLLSPVAPVAADANGLVFSEEVFNGLVFNGGSRELYVYFLSLECSPQEGADWTARNGDCPMCKQSHRRTVTERRVTVTVVS